MSSTSESYQNSTAGMFKVARQHGTSFVSLDIDQSNQGDGGTTSGDLTSEMTNSSDTLDRVTGDHNKATLAGLRFKMRLFVEHIAVQIVSVILILVDVCLTVVALCSKDADIDHNTRIASNVILGYFILEILLRFFAIGHARFLRSAWEVTDTIIILVSLIMTLTLTDPDDNEFGRLSIAGRFVRLVRLVRLIPQCRKCVLSLRLTTSENKRRYREDGYDLDLTYITHNIIAMSFPSSGWLALYRNPIEEVSRFFKAKHKGHFKIYNLCSERDYEYEHFDYSVTRFMIDDHNVPTLYQLLDFVKDASRFLKKSEASVISVHCKGGKGRTGSMICAYLMYSARTEYPTGKEARQYFASRRSDPRVGRKFQGVQTPSQCRFIDYWQEIIHTYDCAIPEAPVLFIKSFKIHSPPGPIQGVHSDLLVEVWDRERPITSFNLSSCSSICTVLYTDHILTIEFLDHVKPAVTGDIKIRFKSSKLPVKYDKASFYFWFNTIFVRDGELYIERDMLDNPHFTKYNKVYGEGFGVTVLFDQRQQSLLIN